MDQNQFVKAFNYAKQNPNSEYAIEFRKRTAQGEFNDSLSKLGVDTSKFKAPEKKDTSFMGGLKRFGSALISNQKNFGESLAGAIQTQTGGGKSGQAMNQAETLKQDTIGQLTQRIQQKREKGEDTSRLMKALTSLAGTESIDETTFNFIKDKTAKQVIGEGVGVAADIIGAGTIGTKGAGIITKPTSVLGGIAQGVKTGAVTGAGFGAVQGGARAAQENQSVTQGALTGAIAGGATGGLVGGVTGGVSSMVRKQPLVSNKNTVESLVSPKMSAKQRAEAIAQGRLEDAGFFKKAQITASKRDKQLANVVSDVVDVNAPTGENIAAIRSKISLVNNGAKNYIKNNKVPFNRTQLRAEIAKGSDELNLIFASDPNAKKTYEAVSDAFVKQLKKGDTEGLFSARQNFDKIPAIKKLLQTEGLGENTRREIVLAVRQQANKYISKLLPKGNPYADMMLDEHLMLEALGNLADKASTSEVGKSQLNQLIKNYPVLRWVVGSAVGGSIVGSLID